MLYEPKWHHFGEIKYKPRFKHVRLCEPLPPTQENTVDIRTLDIVPIARTYPDLYLMPNTLKHTVRRIRRRHGAKIFKTTVAITSI